MGVPAWRASSFQHRDPSSLWTVILRVFTRVPDCAVAADWLNSPGNGGLLELLHRFQRSALLATRAPPSPTFQQAYRSANLAPFASFGLSAVRTACGVCLLDLTSKGFWLALEIQHLVLYRQLK